MIAETVHEQGRARRLADERPRGFQVRAAGSGGGAPVPERRGL